MLPLGLVFVHLRRRVGGARPQMEMDLAALQTAWGSDSPTGYAVAADCIPGDSLPRPLALPSTSTTVPDSNTHPGIDRGNSPWSCDLRLELTKLPIGMWAICT